MIGMEASLVELGRAGATTARWYSYWARFPNGISYELIRSRWNACWFGQLCSQVHDLEQLKLPATSQQLSAKEGGPHGINSRL